VGLIILVLGFPEAYGEAPPFEKNNDQSRLLALSFLI
jgi:hypothetical protein